MQHPYTGAVLSICTRARHLRGLFAHTPTCTQIDGKGERNFESDAGESESGDERKDGGGGGGEGCVQIYSKSRRLTFHEAEASPERAPREPPSSDGVASRFARERAGRRVDLHPPVTGQMVCSCELIDRLLLTTYKLGHAVDGLQLQCTAAAYSLGYVLLIGGCSTQPVYS